MWLQRWFPRGPSLRAWVIGQTVLTVGVIKSIPVIGCDGISAVALVWLGILGGAVAITAKALRVWKNTTVAAALMAFASTVWATPLTYRCASVRGALATPSGWALDVIGYAAMQLVFLAMGAVVFWLAAKSECGWRTPMWGEPPADSELTRQQRIGQTRQPTPALPEARSFETLQAPGHVGGIRQRIAALLARDHDRLIKTLKSLRRRPSG